MALGLGVTMGAGVALLVWGWLGSQLTLADRIAPYVPGPATNRLPRRWRPASRWRERATAGLDRLAGGRDRLERRLAEAGSTMTAAEFRSGQLTWGAAGLTIGLALALLLAGTRGTPLPLLVIVVAGCVLGGIALRDELLKRQVRRRRDAMLAELPALAELLALAVAAGESIRGALTRLATNAQGQIAGELRDLLADVAAGATLGEALDRRTRRCPLPQLVALYDAIATALERGTPLATVLHEQARDIREAGRRALLELGGRKEIEMMVPVVFVILPTTVLFAVFPGLVSLTVLA